MKVIVGESQRGPVISMVIVGMSVVLLGLTVFTNYPLKTLAPILGLIVLCTITAKQLFAWRMLVALIVWVILFIPMKVYSLPATLPFKLEMYRLLVALIAAGWLLSLLADPRVRFRRTPVDGPILLFVFAVLGSVIVNRSRVNTLESEVVKRLLFFASFLVVVYLFVSVIKRFSDVDFIVRALVGGGAVVAALAIVERNTGYNAFNHLHSVMPFLHLHASNIPTIPSRGGRLRVYASAQHPIALGAALALLVPLAIYRATCFHKRRWWLATGLLVLGALSTGSRTATVMFAVIAVVYIWLRGSYVKRFWPALLPALIAIHFVTPGALGTIRQSFFPKGGLVAQQQNASVGSGRLSTLGPALHSEFVPNPLLGEGYGTRVTVPDDVVPVPNAPILDDEWLGILLETGILGAGALAWMFIRFVRRLAPDAKSDLSPRGWLLVAIIASVSSFAVGMLFYDAFSFIQVTFLAFILIGLGSSAYLATANSPAEQRARARNPLLPAGLGQPKGELT
jgi:O-Antigen ligase